MSPFYRALWVWPCLFLLDPVLAAATGTFQSVYYLTLSIFSLWALSKLNVTVTTTVVRQDLFLNNPPIPHISWHKSAQVDK